MTDLVNHLSHPSVLETAFSEVDLSWQVAIRDAASAVGLNSHPVL